MHWTDATGMLGNQGLTEGGYRDRVEVRLRIVNEIRLNPINQKGTLVSKEEERRLPSIRILVADDYKEWRNLVRLLVLVRPEWQIICEAKDGSEAVQKAEELKPDLVLLAIGLTAVNGIEAARQIRQVSPNSKIIFLSNENSPDIVQEALGTGARGYVQKANAQAELLTAIELVFRGRQFVSSGARGVQQNSTAEANVQHRHEAQFYSDETAFLDGLTRFLGTALRAGEVAILLATQAHRDSLLWRLKAQGIDVDAAMQQGTYIPLDAVKTLSAFMVNDFPDPMRFFKSVGDLMEAVTKAGKGEPRRIVACGECASILLAQGKAEAAIRVEQLWDEIARTYDVRTLCGYMLSSFHVEKHNDIFRRICVEHSAISSL